MMKRLGMVVVSIAVVVAAGLLVPRVVGGDGQPHEARLASLVDAAAQGESRPFRVRLSGGFAHRPLERVVRRGDVSQEAAQWQLKMAVAKLQDAAAKTPNAGTLHALGIAQLASRRSDAAVATLQDVLFQQTGQRDVQAAVVQSSNATLLSDLSAAYFVRGQNSGNGRDLIMAAECAMRAWRGDAENGEAAWNRAVIFETAAIADVARQAWTDFLRLDPDSDWAVEARSRLAAMTAVPLAERWSAEQALLIGAASSGDGVRARKLVELFPEQARILVEENMLAEWGDARAAGDTRRADATLRRANIIAEAVAETSNDRMALDAVRVLAKHPDGQDAALARGHRHYFAARELFRNGQHPKAQPMFEAAAEDLRRGGSPLAFRVASYDLIARHYLGRPAEARAEARAALARLGPRADAYPVVAGQFLQTSGLAAMSLGLLDEALRDHRAALARFERTGETSNIAGIELVLVSDYRAVGDLDRAWNHQLRALQLAARYATFERAHLVTGAAAVTALRDGYVAVADELQRGVLARARRGTNPTLLCDALVRRGETLTSVRALGEARKTLSEALTVWGSLPETESKSRLRADLEMVRADAIFDLPPRQRIAELDLALEHVVKTGSRSRIAKVLLLRARAQLDAGDRPAAERDLAAGIAEVEAQREKTTSAETRLTFLNTASELYDEAIRLHLGRNEDARAFDVLERRRARWILDRYASSESDDDAVDGVDVLRQAIPPGVAVVSYAISDRAHAWVLTTDSLRHVVLPHRPDALANDVTALRKSIADGQPLQNSHGAALHAALIEPLRSMFGSSRSLVIVPDRFLNGVPFAALRDGVSGRHLIEDYAITIAPSANAYLRCLARSGTMSGGEDSALAVANPALLPDEELQSLAGAEDEAAAVANTFDATTMLRGAEATVDRFTRAARDASFIHFAGHVVFNAVRPEMSALVLAPDRDGGRTRLYAREVFAMRLPRTRTVVLAACESARGSEASDASLSVAFAFTAAGVPEVIATLWPVEDEESSRFLRAMYAQIRRGASPAEALRAAQIESIRTARVSRSTWAAYQVYGGPSH